MSVDSCIHIANLFYLVSYLCRDILYLRVLTCGGLAFGIIFFCAQTQAMFTPAAWMGLFLIVNLVQIGRIFRERRERKLSPEQLQVSRLLLQRLTRDEMLDILTKSMCDSDRTPKLIEQSHTIELNPEQKLIRNMAFDRLSDEELMNLIVRRFWRSIRRRKKVWFRKPDPYDAKGRFNPAFAWLAVAAYYQALVNLMVELKNAET